MTTLNLVMFIVLAIGLILSINFFLRIRERYYKLKVSETKTDIAQKKLAKEQEELSEFKMRLEEQKEPLNKRWDEIQNEYRLLDEKALLFAQERELIEKQRAEINQQRLEIEQELLKLDNLGNYLRLKWEKEKAEIEKQKNQIRKFVKQVNMESANLDIQKNQLLKESQSLEDQRRQISKKSTELELLRVHYDSQKAEQLKEKANIEQLSAEIKEEIKQIEEEKENVARLIKNINEMKNGLLDDRKALEQKDQFIQEQTKWVQNENKKIEIIQEEIRTLSVQFIIHLLKSIKAYKEKSQLEFFDMNRLSLRNESKSEPINRELSYFSRAIPAFVCRNKNGYWEIGISFEGILQNIMDIEIIQDDKKLEHDKMTNNFWTLESMALVSVRWHEGSVKVEKQMSLIHNTDNIPLLFKLSQTNVFGMLVRYLSQGTYLVIVPEDWRKDASLSNTVFIESENISLPGYKGYFFSLEEQSDTRIAFRKSDGTSLAIASQNSRFNLTGNLLIDNNHQDGPWFGDNLPIISDRFKFWQDVGVIIVSEEENETRKCCGIFRQVIECAELDLNRMEERGEINVPQNGGHCIFINFYDTNDNLLEYLRFRYIKGLKKIEVSEYPILPPLKGHQSIALKFLHDNLFKIDTVKSENAKLILNQEESSTIVNIPPDPALDLTEWLIHDASQRQIKLRIKLRRVWWSLIQESDSYTKRDWQDKPIELSLKHLAKNSSYGIDILLPGPPAIKNIYVGFEKDRRKHFSINYNEFSIYVPLKDFIHGVNSPDKLQLKLWLTEDQDDFTILAELIPVVFSCSQSNCAFKTSQKEEMISHIRNHHSLTFVQKLNYQEIRLKYNQDWPAEIYQCGYCNSYVYADNKSTNPTASIISHVMQCLKAVSRNGNPFISFKIVCDIQEIRQFINPKIPDVFKCILCEKFFENQSEEEIFDHLMSEHEKEIIKGHI